MLRARTPILTLKWIKRYGLDMPTKFAEHMGINAVIATKLIDDFSTTIAPLARAEVEDLINFTN